MSLFCRKFRKKTRDARFISYTCSGATLLENAIIELGIRLKFEEELGNEKQENQKINFFKFSRKIDESFDEYIKTDNLIPSQFGLPSLVDREKFVFRNDLEVFFTHNPKFFSDAEKTFILVRDPRDTLLSQFRINNEKNADQFFKFCQNHIDSWVDFYTKTLSHKNFYLIKFEDLKLSPVVSLKNLMLFLGLEYENEKLSEAINNSSFEKTKKMEDRMIGEYPEVAKNYFPNRITKSGKCYQYKLEENSDLREAFLLVQNKAADIIDKIGY